MKTRRWSVGIAMAIVVVAVGIGGIALGKHEATGAVPSTVEAATAKVVKTDLASTEQVTGTLGYGDAFTVNQPSGIDATALRQAVDAVTVAYATLLNDQSAADLAAQLAAHNVATARAVLAAATSTRERKQLAAELVTAQLEQSESTDTHGGLLTIDRTLLQQAQTALTAAQQLELIDGSTFTSLPRPGDVVERGVAIYRVDSRPVPLFYGAAPQWRAWSLGATDGPDIADLNDNLIALGFGAGLPPGAHFSPATASAITAWQTANGIPATGRIPLGEVVVAPGPLRVASLATSPGTATNSGAIFEATGVAPLVTVELGVDKQHLVHLGDAVTVAMPDRTETTARVTTIANAASCPAAGQTASNPSSSGASGCAGGATPVVDVSVTLDDASASADLDQAPVSVTITHASVMNVLAVPINALLATSNGGDALEVIDADGKHHLVAVTTGLFSNSMVEIAAGEIAAGTVVQVPAE